MKSFIFLCSMLVANTCLHAQKIAFESGTVRDAFNKSETTGKPVFVDCYTTWCGPCKKMDAKVFTDQKVSEFYNTNFINFKFNMESDEGFDFMFKYQILGYPTFLFLDAEGNVLHRFVGYCNADVFLKLGEMAADSEKQLATMQQKYKDGSRNQPFLLEYFRTLKDANLDYESFAEQHLNELPMEQFIDEANLEIFAHYIKNIESEAFRKFVNNKQQFEPFKGASYVDSLILKKYYYRLVENLERENFEAFEAQLQEMNKLQLSNAEETQLMLDLVKYEILNDYEQLAIALEIVIERYRGNDAEALNSYAWFFYERVKDAVLLRKAEEWVVKSININENYYNTDTYACLLYQRKNYSEALKYAKRSIELGREIEIDTTQTELLLAEIKAKL